MSYLGEFRINWRALASASIGLAFGYTFINYVTNVISPHLIAEFGWSKSQFALLGLIIVIAAICQPIAGRLADALGVRRIAMIGVVSAPLLFVALSQMTSSFALFFAINVLQVILVGGTTSVVVYTRLIAHDFNLARGMALGIAASAPAVAGALTAPLLSELVIREGWRMGYLAVAAAAAVFGFLAIVLIPKYMDDPERLASLPEKRPRRVGVRVDYGQLFRNGPFQLIIAGMLLCNLTITLQMSQIAILLEDVGVAGRVAPFLISLYAGGVIVGRLLCGVALDRYPPHLVSAVAMAAPAVGLFVFASGTNLLPAVAFAITMLGLSLGAEGDVGAYLVMRYFDRTIYSSVVGLFMAALSISGVCGALLLSGTLAMTGHYSLFMLIAAIAALIGGLLFVLLGKRSDESQFGSAALTSQR